MNRRGGLIRCPHTLAPGTDGMTGGGFEDGDQVVEVEEIVV
ncbi:MAG: hypothetical protein AABZ47_16180 [Planctomycetota bacterium]